MNPKYLMVMSFIALSLIGLILITVPNSIVMIGDDQTGKLVYFLIQMYGASLIGFGYLNWLARGTALGGVFGRPLIAGNFAHGLIALLVIIRGINAGIGSNITWLLLIWFLGYTFWFSLLLFGKPPENK